MPAKGWRKDDKESNLDTLVANENGNIEQYLFPKSTLNKLAKQILQQTNEHPMLLAKDSQLVIQRGSVLFVNFIYHHAKQIVKHQGRKVVNADDILKALSEVGFQDFIPVLNDELDKFVKKKEQKKLERQLEKNQNNADLDDDNNDADDISQEPNKKMKLINIMNSETPIQSEATSTVETSTNVTELEDNQEEDGDDADEKEVDDASGEEDEEDDDDEADGQNIGLSQLQMEQKELAGVEFDDDDGNMESNDEEDL